MYNFDYRENLNLGRVCLEMSLKPFKEVNDEYINKVCEEIFYQYRDLLRYASSCSILLWAADGSDILDYSGDLDQEMEWARYMGNPNFNSGKTYEGDTEHIALHYRSRLYIEKPPIITYRTLKKIISAIKLIGNMMTGLDIEVGSTFDPGPEFAISDFKYNRHKEIAKGMVMGNRMWCHCASTLHGDDHKYAAYQNGIPENTHLGTFLGQQFKQLSNDVGYDYIWLSNGFGYSLDAWNWRGECFDGIEYKKGIAKKVHDSILVFWDRFTQACPNVRIETRGSNLSTGMDIGAHGSPIKKIFDNYPVTAPPNSPWAALDSKFALEMVGFMSHIAYLPKQGYIFRYYLHDPWWLNSPWFDRYGQQPHDIYLPMMVARIDDNGNTTLPWGLSLLTIDDSLGNLPRRGPMEITPHLLNAYQHAPDTAGPITWLYPFSHYNEIGINKNRSGECCFGDWFINDVIENGLPINTVIADTNMQGLNKNIIDNTVVISVVPDAKSKLEKKILNILNQGGKVLLYGPVDNASQEILDLIGVDKVSSIQGYGIIETTYDLDTTQQGEFSNIIGHKSIISGGGINTITNKKAKVTSNIEINNSIRTYSTYNENALKGSLSWVRGSYSQYQGQGGKMPLIIDPQEHFQSASLMRYALNDLGIKLKFSVVTPNAKRPMILFSRRNNTMYITGFAPDSTVKAHINLQDGAPIMRNSSTIVESNTGEYNLSNWWHDSCRIFVKQEKQSVITSRARASVSPGVDKRIEISGLINAQVTFLVPPDTNIRIANNIEAQYAMTNIDYSIVDNGKKAIIPNVSGMLNIAWGEEAPDHLK